jgi:hypothetical protein
MLPLHHTRIKIKSVFARQPMLPPLGRITENPIGAIAGNRTPIDALPKHCPTIERLRHYWCLRGESNHLKWLMRPPLFR